MHELPIVMSILSMAIGEAKRVQKSKITKIDLCIGGLSGIVPECVQVEFDIISRGTIAAEAGLSFNRPPSILHCRNCNTSYSPENFHLACPNCREQKFEIISGRECKLESIEVE